MTDKSKTLLEAAKQALEALQEIHVGNMTPMAEEAWNKAIEALRQAIEQAEKQEPVAWELRQGKTDRVLIEITNNRLKAYEWQCSLEEVVPLYTAPPQREWVGLTDDEIKKIMQRWRNGYIDIKDVEQLLKEKNT